MCSGASVLLAVIKKKKIKRNREGLFLRQHKNRNICKRQQIQNTCKQSRSAVYSVRCHQVSSRVTQSAAGTSCFGGNGVVGGVEKF